MAKKDKKIKPNKQSLTGSGTLIGNTSSSFAIGNTSTTTSSFIVTYTKKVESTRFVENEKGNYFEVISEEVPSHYITHGWTTTTPGRSMVKDIYGIKDGKIQVISTIRGIEQPGYYVEPDIEWEE
jgi:hypothetical protein